MDIEMGDQKHHTMDNQHATGRQFMSVKVYSDPNFKNEHISQAQQDHT